MITLEKLTKQFINESGWSKEEAPKFAKWYLEVDRLVRKALNGYGIWDIGDWGYADAYEAGWTPAGAAAEVVRSFMRGDL